MPRPSSIEHARDDAAFRAGLMRLERHADHVAGDALGLVGVLRQLDAAALTAAARMDLRLDDDRPPPSRLAISPASAAVNATSPRGTGTPWRARMALA